MEITYFENDLTREELEELNEDNRVSGKSSKNVYKLSSGEGTGLEERVENK